MRADCRCADRAAATAAGLFVRAPGVAGYVDLSRDRAVRRSGFGYVWRGCPWCRGDLPEVTPQTPTGDHWPSASAEDDEC